MVRSPAITAITAGFFGFAIAQGTCGIRGLAFGLSSLAFVFGTILIGSRVLAVSEVRIGFVLYFQLGLGGIELVAWKSLRTDRGGNDQLPTHCLRLP